MSLLHNILVSLIFVVSLQLGDNKVLNSGENNLVQGEFDQVHGHRFAANNVNAPICNCKTNGLCRKNAKGEEECFCDPGYGACITGIFGQSVYCQECSCGRVKQTDGKGRKFNCKFDSGQFGCTKVCTCDATGYYEKDKKCNEVNSCDIGPCKNGGMCKILSPTTFECKCPPTFTGADCTIEVNPCDKDPCKNGGTCKILSATTFECKCPPTFTGVNCTIDVNPCDISPCKNGGTCKKLSATTFECKCPPTFTGANCTIEVNPCEEDPCKNGGTCKKLSATTFECKCTPTFTGGNCTIEIGIPTDTSTIETTTEGFSTLEPTTIDYSTKSPSTIFNFRKMKVEKYEIQEVVYIDKPKNGLFEYLKLKIKNIGIFSFDFQDISESN